MASSTWRNACPGGTIAAGSRGRTPTNRKREREREADVANKDKGGVKTSKKAPTQSIKEKRAAKKAKKAASTSR